jgi:RNA polymerase sigma-70 factor (ECF subfamily)
MLTTQSNAFDTVQLRDLEAAIAKLPQEQRQVILLVALEGLPYEEVASVLQVPIGTVRSRLSRGRSLLRQLMGVDEETRCSVGRGGGTTTRDGSSRGLGLV